MFGLRPYSDNLECSIELVGIALSSDDVRVHLFEMV